MALQHRAVGLPASGTVRTKISVTLSDPGYAMLLQRPQETDGPGEAAVAMEVSKKCSSESRAHSRGMRATHEFLAGGPLRGDADHWK